MRPLTYVRPPPRPGGTGGFFLRLWIQSRPTVNQLAVYYTYIFIFLSHKQATVSLPLARHVFVQHLWCVFCLLPLPINHACLLVRWFITSLVVTLDYLSFPKKFKSILFYKIWHKMSRITKSKKMLTFERSKSKTQLRRLLKILFDTV